MTERNIEISERVRELRDILFDKVADVLDFQTQKNEMRFRLKDEFRNSPEIFQVILKIVAQKNQNIDIDSVSSVDVGLIILHLIDKEDQLAKKIVQLHRK